MHIPKTTAGPNPYTRQTGLDKGVNKFAQTVAGLSAPPQHRSGNPYRTAGPLDPIVHKAAGVLANVSAP